MSNRVVVIIIIAYVGDWSIGGLVYSIIHRTHCVTDITTLTTKRCLSPEGIR